MPMIALENLMNQIATLGNQIRTENERLASIALDPAVPIADVRACQTRLHDLRERQDALRQSYEMLQGTEAGRVVPGAQGTQPPRPQTLTDMLNSNEYARAFAYAMQHGINRKNGGGDPNCKVLYDALTESGGDPTGADGGFLVPEEVEHSIVEFRRNLFPLASLFGEENVTAPTGWRPHDTAPTKGLVPTNEMGQIDDDDDQPVFGKIEYTCNEHALLLPVSNQLLTDNVANLFSYIARWFAKKLVITENQLLISALRLLTATSINSDPIGGLKTALNKGLDPDISLLSSIIVNQDGLDIMDHIVDSNDRPMLQPDPTNGTVMRFSARPIHLVSNATMANISSGGQTTTDLFVGDGKEYATLFRCGGYEFASTDVGGSAWRTNSTEIRGIARLGVSVFDSAAMVRRTLVVE